MVLAIRYWYFEGFRELGHKYDPNRVSYNLLHHLCLTV